MRKIGSLRKARLPYPSDWSWVEEFFAEPEMTRLIEGHEPNSSNPEDLARMLCIDTLRKFCKAFRAGDTALAWLYLEHAERIHEFVSECRTSLSIARWEFWKGWLLMKGPRKRWLSQHPIFKDIARRDGMNADQILAEIRSMEQSRRRLSTPPQPRPMGLKQRGFRCVVEAVPTITASRLIDLVQAGSGAKDRVFDFEEDDIRLYLDLDDKLVIEDLGITGEKTTPIPTKPTDQIRVYLQRARKRNS